MQQNKLEHLDLYFKKRYGAYPYGEALKDAALALTQNIRLGWKVMPRTNTPAYLVHI